MVIQPSDVHIAEYPALLVAILIIRTPVVDPPSEQSVNEVKGFRHKANFPDRPIYHCQFFIHQIKIMPILNRSLSVFLPKMEVLDASIDISIYGLNCYVPKPYKE